MTKSAKKNVKTKEYPTKENTINSNTVDTSEFRSDYALLMPLMCAFVVIMPLLFCKWNDQSPFEMIKAYFSAGSITLIAGFYLISNFFKEQIKIRYNMWVWGLVVYAAVYLLSFAFAQHYYSSIWGVLNLPAGSVMTVMTFVVMSFLATQIFTNRHAIKVLASCFVFTAFLMSIYGIIQHFGGDPINWWVYSEMHLRALSTMGQAVGYGTVLGCCLPLCFVFVLNAKTDKKYWFWLAVWAFINLGILYSGSRLPILAYFIVMAIFLVFLLIFRKKLHFLSWKRVGVAYLVMALANLIYFAEPAQNALKQKLDTDAIKSGYGTRFIVWDTAIDIWKAHPVLGVGPENFGEAFNRVQTIEQNYGESWNLIWHKAHNEFIHYLATTGALGFLAYMALIALMFVPVVRYLFVKEWEEDYLFSVGLLGGFGYLLASNLTAFSFIPTLMFFYLFPAMSYSFAGVSKVKVFENVIPGKMKWVSAALVMVLMFFTLKVVYSVWHADVDYNDSRRQLIGAGNVDAANAFLEKAIEQNPWNAEYWCFRSDVYYNFLLRSMREQPSALVDQRRKTYFDEIVSSSNKCLEMDNRKSDLWRARGTLFLSLSQIVPNMVDISLEAFRKSTEVYPNNPFNHISLAGVYRRKGRNDLAIESLKTAISKRRDILPAYGELLSIYYEEKRPNDIQNLVNSMRDLNIRKSEFYRQMPALLKLANDNGDLNTVAQLQAL